MNRQQRRAALRQGLRSTATVDLKPGQRLPSKAGDILYLTWVRPETIPDDHRTMVEDHIRKLAGELALGTVNLRWFDIADEGTDSGDYQAVLKQDDTILGGVTCSRDTIAIWAGLRGPHIFEVIAHELRHVQQLRASGATGEQYADETGEREADAQQAGIAYLERILEI